MSLMLLLIVAIVALLIIGASVLLLRRAEEDPLAVRIDEFAAREEAVSIEDIELSMPITDRIFVPIVRRISDFVVRFTPQTTLERTARQLELAGNPRNMSAAEFWILRGLSTVVLGVLLFVMMTRNGAEPTKRILWGLGGAALGFYLPAMFLRSMIDRRKQSIIKKLPDALDLMTICVDAGLTFNAAMQKVSEKWDDPLSDEFGRVIYEMQLGKSRRQALKDMSDRTDVPDVTSFIAAVLQAEQLGVGIGKVLRIQSEQMRVRRRQRAEERAQQAPVKMTFPLVFLIFPSIFIVLLGPAGIQVARSEALKGLTG
ncbi:MAG: type II secretion system F family protein [Ardenticatenaceae bacterium]|nr:type II secretion system F family protein [Anaerolineales bacterium]MCB8982761.1 type II secretion system F family protein [Ardenticatenaceae bacterium]MCB8986844.1 type II secretion system F family protein [Ardenticatenaceae bacterium]